MPRLWRNELLPWVLGLVLLGALLSPGALRAAEEEAAPEVWLQEAEADLNGDGKPEKISLRVAEGKTEFELTVNGRSKRGRFEFPEYPPEGFRIVDLDQGEPYREILVKCLGSSDWHQYYFFAFDGRELKRMGCLYRCVTFQGDGVVHSRGWRGFWTIQEKYVVDQKTRTLKKVPQEFYYVGVSGQVRKPFPLYTARDGRQVLTTLKEGSTVEILAAAPAKYPRTWYLVRSEDNLLGWVREDVLLDGVAGLPLAA